MKKLDLQTGMWVENRDGNKYIVLIDTISNIDGWCYLKEYNDDLTCNYNECSNLDIIRVYEKSYTLKPGKLIWERKDKIDNIMAKLDDNSV